MQKERRREKGQKKEKNPVLEEEVTVGKKRQNNIWLGNEIFSRR